MALDRTDAMALPEPSNDRKVLLVEDDPAVAGILRRLLEREGIDCLPPVAEGAEAIQVIRREQPAAVLLDVDLADDVDGIQVAETLSLEVPSLIVFLSGHDDRPTIDRAGATFPLAYLTKPPDERQLLALMHGAFRYRECLRAEFPSGAGSELVTICAWCRRVKGEDGQWMALADYIIGSEVRVFTHGICRSCAVREMAGIPA